MGCLIRTGDGITWEKYAPIKQRKNVGPARSQRLTKTSHILQEGHPWVCQLVNK